VVYVGLPELGKTVKPGDAFGEIESVKAASELFAPVGGTVVEVNTALADNYDVIGKDPFGAGWMIKIKMSNPDDLQQLMTPAAYDTFIAQQG